MPVLVVANDVVASAGQSGECNPREGSQGRIPRWGLRFSVLCIALGRIQK